MVMADYRTVDSSDCDPDLMADEAHHPSPDPRYIASEHVVIDLERGRCQIIARGIVSEFVGWTMDGRYAVFNSGDQYGNRAGRVFDTKKWLDMPIAFRPTERPCGMSGECNFAVRAIAPILKRVLFEDGTLIYLADSQQYTLLADAPNHLIRVAAFSPGEQYLAYVRYDFDGAAASDFAVYVANGEGSDPRHLLALNPMPNDVIRIEWYTDGTPKFTLTVGETQTVINVWTEEINP